MKHDFLFEDSTLREGEQSPGVAFSIEQKVRIAQMLADIGVGALEVGTAASGGPEAEAIEALVALDLPVRLIGWNRGIPSDLEASMTAGLTSVHIGLPASDLHLRKKFSRDRAWVLNTMHGLVAFAKSNGIDWVSVSAEDAGRADVTFLGEYARACQAAGADRMRLSDTVGVLTPDHVKRLVESICDGLDMPIQVHMHNDFGLATANTVAGVLAGARHVHVTVNGLGERAGIAALDEVAMVLKLKHNIDTGIRTEGLTDLARYVAQASGRPLPANKPITGAAMFQHESGIHVDGTLKDATTFEPFPPELVGTERAIVVGKHSGRAAIAYVLRSLGLEPRPDKLGEVVQRVRLAAVEAGGAVGYDVVESICLSLIGSDGDGR